MKKQKPWPGMTATGCIRHRHVNHRMVRGPTGRIVKIVSLRPGEGVLWQRP